VTHPAIKRLSPLSSLLCPLSHTQVPSSLLLQSSSKSRSEPIRFCVQNLQNVKMATQNTFLSILSFSAPSPALTTTLQPCTSLPKSTTISFSFHNGEHEVFGDRITNRELLFRDDGAVVATVNKVPAFTTPVGETGVRMYAWKGERLIGEWEVGSY